MNFQAGHLKKLIEKFAVYNVCIVKKLLKINCSYLCSEEDTLMKKYANYINYFKGTSITKEDMNYILQKNMESLPYNYNLTKVGMVIQAFTTV